MVLEEAAKRLAKLSEQLSEDNREAIRVVLERIEQEQEMPVLRSFRENVKKEKIYMVLQKLKNGMTVSEAAKENGVSKSTVYRWLALENSTEKYSTLPDGMIDGIDTDEKEKMFPEEIPEDFF